MLIQVLYALKGGKKVFSGTEERAKQFKNCQGKNLRKGVFGGWGNLCRIEKGEKKIKK